ncbi:MAG: SAM-dependent DNA methyltransferase [Acidimicrobiia bacterium]|nr:SAM-dependent DNA methyltransferase [Acidimicrobiia bacterium]
MKADDFSENASQSERGSTSQLTRSRERIQRLEQTLWAAADKMRGNLEAGEYKHVVLGLVFLKYVSDAFANRRRFLETSTADESSEYFVPNPDRRNSIVDSRDEYISENVAWVPEEARWSFLQEQAKLPVIGTALDEAMDLLERENPSLRGVLPKNYARPDIDKRLLGELVDLIGSIGFTEVDHGADDVLGRVYEYFLSQFAAVEGRGAGEYYTPRSVVRLLVEMLEPYGGRVYDPCCGSGGMFVQSADFVAQHGGSTKDISIYGQEFVATTWRLAKMNLAIRGIEANLGDEAADSFFRDKHADLRADFIIANPPFNMSDWGAPRLQDDVRWKHGLPPKNNANMAWVQHILHHLAPDGTAGFVLANGSLTSNQAGEGKIRQRIVEADLVDCIVSLPGQLFYSTQIAVSLWFLTKRKRPRAGTSSTKPGGDRTGRTLFIDGRALGLMVDRTHKDLSGAEIQRVADAYRSWKAGDGTYRDEPGFCREASLEEIRSHRFALVPGRYVGFAARPQARTTDTERLLADLAETEEQLEMIHRLSRSAVGVLKGLLDG